MPTNAQLQAEIDRLNQAMAEHTRVPSDLSKRIIVPTASLNPRYYHGVDIRAHRALPTKVTNVRLDGHQTTSSITKLHDGYGWTHGVTR
ncbi:hypothetical protein F443_22702 [Phytophthora nicotianae P1569]|uniref:Uncharacterized protein n=1 Tax=Phytophthora nicotianae P1569 TaxID=1317065 RepID=V9DTE9_PHYNI|nr:hypothetical protein F443_22702 [Phytophthora nicotianae P1569]